jgi:hypothetical protein
VGFVEGVFLKTKSALMLMTLQEYEPDPMNIVELVSYLEGGSN